MRLIDRETVQRILDTADIVDVVSDFVSLKKRGANYIGLCPFHNERTPSFSVSRTKGICKCFSCGKGGSAVGFVMEHEQMTYNEALRYLARKYHIDIKERELTDQEREEATERESMLAVNDFALKHFCRNMSETADGRDIGLAYFRERGINDAMVERFKLGYSLDRPDALLRAALDAGYEEKYLVKTGLCSRSDRGTVYDRFRGRVMYPVFSVSGRVVAFGGRTLRSDKNVAKYVNSPESAIYHKSRELYGLYQAKGAIVKADKCILVEGYMDVISMHQVGVENVVASSGTSLTEGQIRMIHRFTENVTVIYDADPAGIKASLRGIDLLLAEGMNIKVVLLPQGEDPDSFAQSHNGNAVLDYLAANEKDFITFKTDILLKGTEHDPMERARAINDIVRSISVIPDAVVRAEYVKACSQMLQIDDSVLLLQISKAMAERLEQMQKQRARRQAGEGGSPAGEDAPADPGQTAGGDHEAPATVVPVTDALSLRLREHEKTLVKYILKYGMCVMPPDEEAPDEPPMTVLEFIWGELDADDIHITDPVLLSIYLESIQVFGSQWQADIRECRAELDRRRAAGLAEGLEQIRREAVDLADIEAREKMLNARLDREYALAEDAYAASYLESAFISSPDDAVRLVATDLVCERYQLSKVHTKYSKVETEKDRLGELVPRAVLELKLAILDGRIAQSRKAVKAIDPGDPDALRRHIEALQGLYGLRSQFAKLLGERIVTA